MKIQKDKKKDIKKVFSSFLFLIIKLVLTTQILLWEKTKKEAKKLFKLK